MADVSTDQRLPADEAHCLDNLVCCTAEGDEESLMALYYLCRRGIFSVSYAVTRDYQLSEDVLQETMIRIWEHSADYKANGNAKSWIYAIARNLSLDLMKQRNRLVSMEDFEDLPLPEALTTQVNYDDRLTLLAGIDCLDSEEAMVFVLKTIAGLSHLESARLLKIPYRTARYRYRQAIAKLRGFLSEPVTGEVLLRRENI